MGEYVRLEEESVVILFDLLLDAETVTSLTAELEYTGVRSGSLCCGFPSVLQMVIFSNLAAIARASEFVINLFWVWIVGLFVLIWSPIFISLPVAWKCCVVLDCSYI